MPWSVKYNSVTKIVEVIYTGSVTGDEIQEAVNERIRIQNEHASLFVIIDCSQVTHMPGGIFDVHYLPTKIYEKAKASRLTCHALVLSKYPQAREASLHYETACINRGWCVKTFDAYSDAVTWLEDKMTSDKSAE